MIARRTVLAALAFAAVSVPLASASAELYPSRPITIVVPFPQGDQPIRSHALCLSR